jgi:hypothetical protein
MSIYLKYPVLGFTSVGALTLWAIHTYLRVVIRNLGNRALAMPWQKKHQGPLTIYAHTYAQPID